MIFAYLLNQLDASTGLYIKSFPTLEKVVEFCKTNNVSFPAAVVYACHEDGHMSVMSLEEWKETSYIKTSNAVRTGVIRYDWR